MNNQKLFKTKRPVFGYKQIISKIQRDGAFGCYEGSFQTIESEAPVYLFWTSGSFLWDAGTFFVSPVVTVLLGLQTTIK